MLEDFRLKVFATLVQEHSFTKAAQTLGITQPAVSQNIAELEKGLGVKLFDRLRGEVVLTQEGRIFEQYADRMLRMAVMTGDMFSRLQPSTVRVSASEELYAYLLSPALEDFSRLHPEIVFERVMFEDSDLHLLIRPSDGSQFDSDPDAIARIRVSMSETKGMGSLPAAHEHTSYFNLLYQPSQTFSCTKICRLLKDFLLSSRI